MERYFHNNLKQNHINKLFIFNWLTILQFPKLKFIQGPVWSTFEDSCLKNQFCFQSIWVFLHFPKLKFIQDSVFIATKANSVHFCLIKFGYFYIWSSSFTLKHYWRQQHYSCHKTSYLFVIQRKQCLIWKYPNKFETTILKSLCSFL